MESDERAPVRKGQTFSNFEFDIKNSESKFERRKNYIYFEIWNLSDERARVIK